MTGIENKEIAVKESIVQSNVNHAGNFNTSRKDIKRTSPFQCKNVYFI